MIVEEESNIGNILGISITSLLKELNVEIIDILKLDIEKSEKVLFLNNYEDWLPKCKIIIIELHDRIKEGCAEIFFKAINKSFKNINQKYVVKYNNYQSGYYLNTLV